MVFHPPIWKICSSKWVHLPQRVPNGWPHRVPLYQPLPRPHRVFKNTNPWRVIDQLKDQCWLVVEPTHLKVISNRQIGNLPPFSGWKLKNIWNHQLDIFWFLHGNTSLGGWFSTALFNQGSPKLSMGAWNPKYYGGLFRWLDTPLLISWEYDERCLGLYVGPKNSSPQKTTKIEKPLD